MAPGVSFLVAEDDSSVGRYLARVLGPHGNTELFTTMTEAQAALAAKVFHALVVDVGLPDGSGFNVARTARTRDPAVPVLVLSGRVDAERLAEAHTIGVHYLLKPVDSAQLEVFALRALARAHLRAGRIEAAVKSWTYRYDLTTSEASLLDLSARGALRSELADLRRVAPSTIKKQVQMLLDKTHNPSLDVAVARLLRTALDED